MRCLECSSRPCLGLCVHRAIAASPRAPRLASSWPRAAIIDVRVTQLAPRIAAKRLQCAALIRRELELKIAVLFGGDSMERDVSIASASQVVGALRGRGHEVIAYDSGRGRLGRDDEQRLFAGKIDKRPPEQS